LLGGGDGQDGSDCGSVKQNADVCAPQQYMDRDESEDDSGGGKRDTRGFEGAEEF